MGRPPSYVFLPLAMEAFGHLHTQFDGLLRQAVRDILSHTGALLSVLATHLPQRISVTIQQVQALAIHRPSLAIGGGPPMYSHPTPMEELHPDGRS